MLFLLYTILVSTTINTPMKVVIHATSWTCVRISYTPMRKTAGPHIVHVLSLSTARLLFRMCMNLSPIHEFMSPSLVLQPLQITSKKGSSEFLSFKDQKCLNMMRFKLSFFFLIVCALTLPNPRSQRFSPTFSSRSLGFYINAS